MGVIFKQKAYVYAIIYLVLIPVFAWIYSYVALDLGDHHKEGAITYLYFSVVSITTLGYGDILPCSSAAQITTASEALLGLILIGLFLNALSMQHSQEIEKVEQEKKVQENKVRALSRLNDLTFYRGEDESFRLFGALKYVLSLGVQDVSIPEGKLTKLKIKSIKLCNSNLVAVDFSNSKLNDVQFVNCNLEAAQFLDTDIKKCSFTDVNLKRSKFINSQLKGMNFNSCDIKNVMFKNCELQSAIFNGADCKGVSFKGCNLRSANFKNAKNITEKMLKEAKDYRYITLPDEINL
ncbi:MAG: hypothetical protein ACJAXJ_004175 [Colwellia sp.]